METTGTLEALERRLGLLEDHLALQQLFSALAPTIDTGTPDQIAAFFTEDGEYVTDVPGTTPMKGRQQVMMGFSSDMHRQSTLRGSGHTIGPLNIQLNGNSAMVICYTVLFLRKDDGWYVHRVASNRFLCVRTADGWHIQRRENRQLGTEEGRALFSAARVGNAAKAAQT